jgi:bacterioferritin
MRQSIRRTSDGEQTDEFSRKDLINALNEDLSRECQAVIAYVDVSQSLKGAQYIHRRGAGKARGEG